MKKTLLVLAFLSVFNGQWAAAGTSIAGGEPVKAGSAIARRTAGLILVDDMGRQATCTGVILSKGAILTAAHCLRNPSAIFVVFAREGIADIVTVARTHPPIPTIGPNYRIATGYRQLKGYSGQLGGGAEFSDLGVVTFYGGLPAGYEPALFLNQSEGHKYLQAGSSVVIAGYGIQPPAEQMQPGFNPKSNGNLRQTTMKFVQFTPEKKNMILQGQGKAACKGDSGGPAMVVANGEVYIVGIASRSNCNNLAVYTWVPREKASL